MPLAGNPTAVDCGRYIGLWRALYRGEWVPLWVKEVDRKEGES
jgi:hypothetical protein